jgi:cell wall-associated NlpC family hydrolase
MAMRDHAKFVLAAISAMAFCGVVSNAQETAPSVAQEPEVQAHKPRHPARHTLSKDDRSSVVAVALHSRKARPAGRDCSHLVHSIYQRAGFPYPYADSQDLYDGTKGFQRVAHPEAADLIVWHGHVGIVIRPAQHQFFSLLSTGPGIDDYHNRYWKSRGQPRFYRYVKSNS